MAADIEDGDKENAAPFKMPNKDVRDSLSMEDRAKFNSLVLRSKELAVAGEVRQALELNQKAIKICHSEKLAKRIKKMEDYIKEVEDDDEGDDGEGDDMVHMGEGFHLYKDLFKNLYAHQREGVLWLWRIFKQRKGGILGDDMGLGKTIQVIAFLSGMFDAERIHTVLIVLPVAVMMNWEREFEKWAPGIRVENFHGGSKRDRERVLTKLHRRGGVVMTSYGMLVNNADQLSELNGKEHVWDSIILDEGHKIKNPSNKCSKGLQRIAARHRVILTGTPVQNNLKEMWALFEWTHQGSLLGNAKTFSMEFDGPITRARQADATPGEERLGQEMAISLKKIIAPYFLRRTKAQVTKDKALQDKAKREDPGEGAIEAKDMPTLTRKNDLIIWAYMSDTQQKIYQDFAQSAEVAEMLNSTKSPLCALMVLKKICDHPRLLTKRQCMALGLDMKETFDEASGTNDECAANRIDHIPNEQLKAESGKMVFLIDLVDNLKAEGHRCLIFSQSRKVLNILQKVLSDRGHKVARIDGTMRHLSEREEVIKKFSKNDSYSVFLLTTQVGGVGLTITAADRVIIYDPSWNPATDAQAVDRAFRIGQERNVVVYRIITCGSIEEKIYRRQIFKDSITKLTTGENKNPIKYFTRQQLFELFTLDNPRESETQKQLAEIHAGRRNTDTSLDAHIAFLHSTDIYGISDHDLMFTREAAMVEDDAAGTEYVGERVKRAQQLLQMECEENVQLAEQLGKYPGPSDKPSKPAGHGGGGVGSWEWPQPSSSSQYDEDGSSPQYDVDSKALIDITKMNENPEDSETGESESESGSGGESDLEQEVQNLHIGFGEHGTPKKPDQTPLGDKADKPILLSDTPVRWSPSKKPNRAIINETLSNSQLQNRSAHETSIQVVQDSGDESMVVESSDEGEASFHTPGAKGRLSTEVYGKRESPTTPDQKISTKKRRKSCAWTPGRGAMLGRPISPNASGDLPGLDNVVSEEIVFSPSKSEPMVQTEVKRLPKMSISAHDLPENDQAFTNSLMSKVNCNSTTLFDNRGHRGVPPSLSALDETLELTSESGDSTVRSSEHDTSMDASPAVQTPTIREATTLRNMPRGTPRITPRGTPRITPRGTPRTLLDDSANDSPIMATKTRQRKVLISDDEDDMDEVEDTVSEDSLHRDSSITSPVQHRQSLPREPATDHEASMVGESEEDSVETSHAESERSEQIDGEEEEEEEEEEDEEEEEEDEDEEEDDEEEEEEEEELTEEEERQYMSLMKESRKFYKEGDFTTALATCLDALEVYSGDDRANQYAMKLQKLVAQ